MSKTDRITSTTTGGIEDGGILYSEDQDRPRLTTRGFTGHEHLAESGVIHMNGRAYDPEIGRFMSVDPFVAFPDDGQSFNPYSYVMNNPLKYTDPSGYVAKDNTSNLGDEFYEELGDKINACEGSCDIAVVGAGGKLIGIVRVTKSNGAKTSGPSGASSGNESSSTGSSTHQPSSTSNTTSYGAFTDQYPNATACVKCVIPAAGGLAAADGPLPVGDMLALGLIGAAIVADIVNSADDEIKQLEDAGGTGDPCSSFDDCDDPEQEGWKAQTDKIEYLRTPNKRHYLDKVNQKSRVKEKNTVIESWVDVEADYFAIKEGRALTRAGEYLVNGRVYGIHNKSFFPIRGKGFHTLNRGEYSSLGMYNTHGNTERVRMILNRMKVPEISQKNALRVWRLRK